MDEKKSERKKKKKSFWVWVKQCGRKYRVRIQIISQFLFHNCDVINYVVEKKLWVHV